MRPYVPPSCGNVVNTPMITDETAKRQQDQVLDGQLQRGQRHQRAGDEREEHAERRRGKKFHPWVMTR